MRKRKLISIIVWLPALLMVSSSVCADDIRVFSGGAPSQALRSMVPEFERLSGHKVQFEFLVISAIKAKLASGEKPAMVIMQMPNLDALIAQGTLTPDSRQAFGSVGIAMIVRQGAALPDISTPEKLRTVLLDARSLVHSNPKDTPSGAHMPRVMEQLGIAEAMRRKTLYHNVLDGGVDMITTGKADFGLYQLSAVISVKGVEVAGMLPPTLQMLTVYGAAVMADNASPDAAQNFIKFLGNPANHKNWKQAGFEPPVAN